MTDWCFITCCVSSSDLISQVSSPQLLGVQTHVKIWLIMLILCNRDGIWLEFWGPSWCSHTEIKSTDQLVCYARINVVNPKRSFRGPIVQMIKPWFLQPGWRACTFLWRRSLWTALLRSTSWKWSWRSCTRGWAWRTAAPGSNGMSSVSHTAD